MHKKFPNRNFLLLSIALLASCGNNASSRFQSHFTHFDQNQVDPSEVFIQKLGGPIGYEIEMEAYLKRVLNRLNTLASFREYELSLEIINHHQSICLCLDNGKIILSRGLLLSLSNEAELITSIVFALLSPISFSAENLQKIALLPDEITEEDFSLIRASLKDSYEPIDLEHCEEIIASLGYSKKGLYQLLKSSKDLLIGFDSLQSLNKKIPNAKEQNSTGYLGEASYQKMIAPLIHLEESYELEQNSLKLFKEEKITEALTLINHAINENPAEGHFYYTLSKILLSQNSTQQAFKAINQAIKLNNFNVLFYLQRAKLYELLQNKKESLEDKKFANELLLAR